ncbi:MAG TPA: ROK family protein [Pseudomonadales bacterium]
MSGRARIGIDLGGTKIEGIRLHGDGAIGARLRVDTPRDDYAATVIAVAELARTLDVGDGLKIGIGAPGAWIPRLGRMQNCNSTWLNGRPLLQDLAGALGDRVRLANDADCFALSEAHDGSAAGRNAVFGVILGTGVGGGLVVGGRLLQGPNGLTGEWGHTPLAYVHPELPARRCYCGRLNCVETFLSGPGLLATHRTLWPEETEAPASAAALYEAAALAEAGEDWFEVTSGFDNAAARARTSLSVYCRLLAENLAQMVNIVDPDAIVLGGGLSQMTEIYPRVRELMKGHVFGELFETELLAPAFGAASGVRGAAWLWSADE